MVFPNAAPTGRVTTEVDKFLATRVGDAAWEVPVANSVRNFRGVYTATFLDAFPQTNSKTRCAALTRQSGPANDFRRVS